MIVENNSRVLWQTSCCSVIINWQAVGSNGAEQTVVSGSMEVPKPCWAVATSGVPVYEQLFNASICHHGAFNVFHNGEFSKFWAECQYKFSGGIAAPILRQRKDGHRHRKGSHGDIIFLTNRGEVYHFINVSYV